MIARLETLAELDAWRTHLPAQKCAFVPTMGALHAGHMELVKVTKSLGLPVLVSVFVNPTQFGPNEDFARYPRTEAADIALLETHGADAVFLPRVEVVYPPGFASEVRVRGVSEGLCGAVRPGHFDGVATVVARLFGLIKPSHALFGEKDFQQLQVIRRMVADLALPVEVLGVPTVREADGLALSSRNRYLSLEERAIAPQLYITLQQAAASLQAGLDAASVVAQAAQSLRESGFGRVDYVAYTDAESLTPRTHYAPNGRLLAAAFLGKTRLIDNIAV